MRSETFVINLIKSSTRVRMLIAGLLGSWVTPDRFDLLTRLPRHETIDRLAAQLQCNQNQVFQKLASRIEQNVEGRSAPLFTGTHLRQLTDVETRNHLARALNYNPHQVFDNLFDVRAILDTLLEADPVEVLGKLIQKPQSDSLLPSAKVTLDKVLEMCQKIVEHYQISESDWGKLLDQHYWLRNEAITRLQSYAAKQGFAPDIGANLLAAAIERQTYRQTSDGSHLDALAVLHIQRRIDWIVRQLREQSWELANTVGNTVPPYSPLARLQPYVEFYELNAPASAWRIILGLKGAQSLEPEPTMQEKISKMDISSTGKSGTPKIDSNLRVRIEELHSKASYWSLGKKSQAAMTNLVVSCEVEEHDLPVDILIGNNLSSSEMALLEKLFSSLPVNIVPRRWLSDIGSEFLKLLFTQLDSFYEALAMACTQLQPKFIQALILAGIDLPHRMSFTWDRDISYQLPFTPVEPNQDTIFPLDREDILNLVKQGYVQQDNLRIIE